MKPQKTLFKFPAARILIFAKAPVENQVKTRLVQDIGADSATVLYQTMLEQIVKTVANSFLCPASLYCSPDTSHKIFQQLHSQYSVELKAQQGKDLGERMYNAASQALQTSQTVIIVGTDCLQMTESHLGQVLADLIQKKDDAVITPAEDGGYVLIGLNGAHPDLFNDIEWGSDRVMLQTRDALKSLGWQWKEMSPLRDIDELEDLHHVYKNKHQYHLDTGVHRILRSIFEN